MEEREAAGNQKFHPHRRRPPIELIDREMALRFYQHWRKRVLLDPDHPDYAGTSAANRDIGNMRHLHRECFRHIGEENRPNPFRNMRFRETIEKQMLPFDREWIEPGIQAPGALTGLNDTALPIVFALIENGCRACDGW